VPAPWYERYFTADYWTFADAEYTAQRTAAEVAYLAARLERYAPGRRILDLGCGTGRHAVGLARLGYEVIGVDVSEYALRRAARAAAAAGVRLELHRADLLGPAVRTLPRVDAVICVQAFGWGDDGDQLRLLRQLRRSLPADGVLLLDHSSVVAITRRYAAEGTAEVAGTTFQFLRRYDPLTGRSSGEVRVRRPDGSAAVLPDDVRLYHPAEVAGLLSRAGFAVHAVDADFAAGAPVTLDTRYVQFVAGPRPVPEPALAGHRAPVADGVLDLRSAPDEAQFVAPAIAAAWAEVSACDPPVPDRARRYDLADPYGGARAAPVLAAHLGWPALDALPAERVSAGAGATGLLHGLARLADGARVLVDPAGHPELPLAAAAGGAGLCVAALGDPAGALDAVRRHRPAVTVLDRPALVGSPWPVAEVRALAGAAADSGGVLVVDETCGGYLGPGQSVAPLTDTAPALVVLRSLSKGYCCGGLRVGFAIASPDAAGAVREVIAPLAAGALALDVALALLRQPDPLADLRARIARVRPRVRAMLAGQALPVLDTDPRLPWLVLAADEAVRDRLRVVGLAAKEVPVLRPDGRRDAVLRLSVPLSAARWSAFEAALAPVGEATPGAGL
jgi:histidinol-phosphate/aromatic aminotransferase/cobyric acid decarboxylase-like protein/SAM-dependent methyltransferase